MRRVLLSLVLLLSSGLAWAGTDAPAERGPVSPQVPAARAEQAPRIDGKLDDACWAAATHVTGFWRMENSAREREATEAWICYDAEAIYVAWRCHDSQPDRIVAQQRKRGGSLVADDWVGIDLDVDFDQQRAYWFDVSAGGVQVESIPGGSPSKTEWRGDWQAATTRTEDGWQAEIALPLRIFRYPQGQSTFGFVLIRRLARADDWSVWPDVGSNFELAREAAWSGLELPASRQGPVFMPYSLAVGGGGEGGATAGLDVKQQFRNGLESLVSYNPDFRDIEDTVETIDFTYVERQLPEYRPFFLEGGGYLPWTNIFYTRRIKDFDGGAKLFGQTGNHGIGALVTSAPGAATNWAFNERYRTSPYQSFQAALVSHEAVGDPRNLAYELNTDHRYPRTDGELSYWAAWRGTSTDGLGGDGSSVGCGLSRSRNQGRSWDLGLSAISAGFAPALGYAPETAVHSTWASLSGRKHFDAGPVLDRTWYSNLSLGASQQGGRWGAGWGLGFNRRDQRNYGVDLSAGARDGFAEHTTALYLGWGNRDLYRNGGVSIAYGERLTHPYRYLSLSQAKQLGARLSLQLRAEHVSASEFDDAGLPTEPSSRYQLVLTSNYDVTWERSVSARVVKWRDGANWYLALRQKTRLGTDAWVIVGDPNADHFIPRVAVKLVRVL